MAAAEELKSAIKTMIVDRLFLKVAAEEIPDEASLMDTYGIDSVNLFEIVVGLEEDFGVSLEDTDFSTETFSTVSNIAEFVVQKRG